MEFKCRAPWEGLFINPDGDLRVCCGGQSLGNLNNNTLEELLTDGPLANLRNDMLTKGYSSYCTGCHEQHKRTGKSLRDLYNNITEPLDQDKFIPKAVDIRWNNTCQLRCNYCNPEWSSAYASWSNSKIKASDTEWQPAVLKYIKENTSRLHDIQLLGGEPLLLRENLELLKLADKETRIGVVTNLSMKNINNLPVYQALLDLGSQVAWLVSFECVGDKFEYVRRNAKWELTEFNYKQLKAINSDSVGIHYTYTLMSAFTLVETFDWLYSIDPNPENNTSFISTLDYPAWLDVMNYPKEIKELAIEQIEEVESKYKDFINDKTSVTLATLKQEIINKISHHNLSVMKRFDTEIKKWDKEHSKTFKELWPKIHNIIYSYIKP